MPELPQSELTSDIPELENITNTLLEKIRLGHDATSELEKYILVYALAMNRHAILQTMEWHNFVLQPKDTFNVSLLPDIAPHVRNLLHGFQPTSLLARFVNFSMPFIKHNRMCFPQIKASDMNSVINLIRILMATCLGAFPSARTQPPWKNKCALYYFFLSLLSSADLHKMYNFCMNNQNILRVAILEYYIFFVQAFCPVEMQLQTYLFGKDVDVKSLFLQFSFVMDTFRQNIQTELTWSQIDDYAHSAVERCNRACRIKHTLSFTRKPYEPVLDVSPDHVRLALDMPLAQNAVYVWPLFRMREESPTQFHKASNLHNIVRMWSLPRNIIQKQLRALKRLLKTDSFLAQRKSLLFLCYKCAASSGTIQYHNVRLAFQQDYVVTCNVCESPDYVVKFNMIGRILRAGVTHFYWCSSCCNVHVWSGLGSEFGEDCPYFVKPSIPKHQSCAFCMRHNQLTVLSILDERIGVMQRVVLCSHHKPYDHMLPNIYNLDTLLSAIAAKKRR